jgi:hypothetical protein
MWYDRGITNKACTMINLVARKELTPLDEVNVLKEWVSPSKDYEVRLLKFDEWFSVTVFVVEIPEDGEPIPAGEEFIETINLIRTLSLERAEAKFQEAVVNFS